MSPGGTDSGNGSSATAWPWRSSLYSGSSPPPSSEGNLPEAFFSRPAEILASDLLGVQLVSTVDGVRTSGVIVETEAYVGPDDPASHARRRIGRTARNDSMFGPAGRAYVYRSYGIHWCMNVVAGTEGDPVAVLIRGLDPFHGRQAMAERRGRDTDLCSGPGRLCQALGITGEFDGHALSDSPLYLRKGWVVDSDRIGVSGRVGISEATDWPLRFFLKGNPSVSRAR